MEPFPVSVERVIRALLPGEVSTYGEVAREAGYPGAARAVGRLLSEGGDLPWWRVVRSDGRLVPGHEAEHTRRLQAEGAEVDTERGRVRWPSTAGELPSRPARPRGMRTTKLTGLLAVLVCLGASASACGDSQGDARSEGQGTVDPWGRTFLSVSVTEAGQDRPLAEGTRIRLDFRDDGRTLGAQAGCNSMGGEASIDEGDRLVVADMSTTEMGCDPPRHDQDRWLAGFLTAGPTLRLTSDDLTLTGEDSEIRLLDREAVDPDRPLAGTRWVVDTIVDGESASSVPTGAEAHLVIASDGRFTGSTGCNAMSGTTTLGPDDTINFSDVMATTQGCKGDRARLEQAVSAVLDGEIAFDIEADVLRLDHPDGRGLGLRATPNR